MEGPGAAQIGEVTVAMRNSQDWYSLRNELFLGRFERCDPLISRMNLNLNFKVPSSPPCPLLSSLILSYPLIPLSVLGGEIAILVVLWVTLIDFLGISHAITLSLVHHRSV